MKRTAKRIVKVVALLLCLVLTLPLQTKAALPETMEPQASQYIANAYGEVYAQGNGKLSITFDIETTVLMKKLGVKTIVLYESTDDYNYFPVRVYYSSDYTGMMGSNSNWHSYSLSYSGVARRYYRASFVFYAETSSGVTNSTTEWSIDVIAN